MKALQQKVFSPFGALNVFHGLNDGYVASLLLFLPFIAKDFHLSLTQVGVLGTILKSSSIFLAIPAGYIAKRIGGFHAILLAAAVYTLGYFGVGFSSTYLLLFTVFLFGGLGYGIFHPIAFALIARWTPKERRGRQMGNFTATGDIGKIGISSLLTVIVAAIGWRTTAFIYAGVASGIILLFYLLFLKTHDTKTGVLDEKKNSVHMLEVLKNKRFLLASLTGTCDNFASSAVYIFLPFLLLQRFVPPALLGLFISAFFIGNLCGKTMFGRVSDRISKFRMYVTAEVGMAILIIILAYSHLIPLLFVCAILLGLFTTGTVPINQTMVLESVEHQGDYEKAFGLNEVITSLASTVAPLLLGFLSDHYSITVAFDVMAGAAIIATIPAFLFQRVKKHPILTTEIA